MSLTSVQTQFFDTFGPGFPGQLSDYGSNTLTKEVRSFRTETVITFGRGVVKGTANAPTDPIMTPYGVKSVLAGSVLADFVGIAVLTESSTNSATNTAVTLRDKTMIPVAEKASGALPWVEVPAGITIVHGDPVYMSVSHATIPVGAFSNAADTGLIAITGSTWYGAAAAGTVGRIKL